VLELPNDEVVDIFDEESDVDDGGEDTLGNSDLSE
jgi:hypothetical protein